MLTSTGTKLANVGMVDISPDGTISTSSLATSELTVTPDAKVAARAEEIQKEIDADYGTVFAKTEVALDGEKANVRTGETNLGDLIADAMLWQAGLLDEGVDAAVTNGGGIRASIAAGDITCLLYTSPPGGPGRSPWGPRSPLSHSPWRRCTAEPPGEGAPAQGP